MGCGASTVAPVAVEDPLDRARRERQEEAERNAERLANQRRVTFDEQTRLDNTPGAWSQLDVFYKHFEDVYVHYRSKYTVFCIQDIQQLVEDCYECFLVSLEQHLRATDSKLKNEKPSTLRELVKSNMFLYFPGKERKDVVNGLATYIIVKIGKDGFITKHQFETLWPKLHETLFTPGITDAKARKLLVTAISRSGPAPIMPKHVRVSRSIENDTGNDQSLPLTNEETALLRKKPYRWTDPQVFLQHIEHMWAHYANSLQVPSIPVNILYILARDIMSNIMAGLRTRMRANYPSLDLGGAEYERRLNSYIRRVMPVQYKYIYNKVNLADMTVAKDIEESIVAYFAYYLDYDRTGIIFKDTFLILFPTLYLRMFDYDQKFTHAYIHNALSHDLAAIASNTLFTSGVVGVGGANYVPVNPRVDEADIYEEDTLVTMSPTNRSSHKTKVLPNLETLPEVEVSEHDGLLSGRSGMDSLSSSQPEYYGRASYPRRSITGSVGSMNGLSSHNSNHRDGLMSLKSTRNSLIHPSKKQALFGHRGNAPMVQESVDDASSDLDMQAFIPRSTRVLKRSNGVINEKKQSTIDPNNKAVIRAMLLTSPSSGNNSQNSGLTSPRQKQQLSTTAEQYVQKQVREQSVPANVQELLPNISITDLPLPELWPLLLGSGYTNETTLSMMRPEDIAQPRINARRLSVWDANISNEALVPIDTTDEMEIDRERLRRLTIYTTSMLTMDGLYSLPLPKHQKLRTYLNKLRGNVGMKSEKGTLKRSMTAQYKTPKVVEDVPDFDSDDEFDGDEALSKILRSKLVKSSSASVELDKNPQTVDVEDEDIVYIVPSSDPKNTNQEEADSVPVSMMKSSSLPPQPDVGKGKTVDVLEEEEDEVIPQYHRTTTAPIHTSALEDTEEPVVIVEEEPRESVITTDHRTSTTLDIPVLLSPDSIEPAVVTPEARPTVIPGYFAELNTPCIHTDDRYQTEITNLAQEVEATRAALTFSDCAVEMDSGVLMRPPFARLYPVFEAMQEDSGDRFITGSLAEQLYPEDTSVLLGKSTESKEMRLQAVTRLVEYVLAIIDKAIGKIPSAKDGVLQHVAGINELFVADVYILQDCAAPLRHFPAELVAANMMVGKEPQVTNRLLQTCILVAYLYRE